MKFSTIASTYRRLWLGCLAVAFLTWQEWVPTAQRNIPFGTDLFYFMSEVMSDRNVDVLHLLGFFGAVLLALVFIVASAYLPEILRIVSELKWRRDTTPPLKGTKL
ncbi:MULTISPECIES: hypothetical protein [Achromobacter]|uniref:hypothetical protein n=1 Tax=Achromobacter TaxID=222 RepID=UPI0023F99C6B|nr:hypothetical protein [Achromobacter anxifer]MDF8363336.1 hypothetical protein [Achromobacter anxifer]